MPRTAVTPTLLCPCLVAAAALAVTTATTPLPYGAESPQAVVATLDRARTTGDVSDAIAVISPGGRRELAQQLGSGVLMILRFANPDDRPPGTSPLSADEIERKRTAFKEGVELARRALAPDGLDELIGRAPLTNDVARRIDRALDRGDTVRLVSETLAVLEQLGRTLGLARHRRLPSTSVRSATTRSLAIAPPRAAGEMLVFERIDGRWYLAPPATPAEQR